MRIRLFLLLVYLSEYCILADRVASFIGRSFTLSSTISVIYLDPTNQQEQYKKTFGRFHENYSVEQKRARLNFFISTSENNTSKGIFFLEHSKQTALVFDSQTSYCTNSIDFDTILKLIGFDHVPFLQSNSTIAAPYIIGPARLLYLIDKRKSELKLVLNYVIMGIKNIPAKLFTLDIDTEYRLSVYYNREDEVREIPIQIQLISSTISIQISLSRFSLILDRNQLSESQMLVMRNGAQLDRFAFPPLKSCIQVLDIVQRDTIASIYPKLREDDGKTKFSFKALITTQALKVNTTHGKLIELKESPMVAYDGGLKVLKLDLQRNSQLKRQLVNYKTSRMFQITFGTDTSDSSAERCLVSKIPNKDVRSSISMLLFGSDSLVYLGRATIRGIGAKLYGAYGGSLPSWLEQSTEYKIKLMYDVRRPDNANALIVLYLSDSLEPIPLHIDITQYYTKHSIDFYDFRWDLDHSIQASDQFSLSDFCSQSDQKHSRVELTLKDVSDETMKLPMNIRNLALLASFQDNFYLPVNMVSDLESTEIKDVSFKSTNYLLVTFRVATQKETMMEIEYLGQGKVNPFADSPTTTISARTFHECFDVAGAQQQVELFFGYDAPKRSCVIDHGQTSSYFISRGPYAFILGKGFPMEVYQLKRVPDESVYLYDINARWNHKQTRLKFIGELLKSKLPLANDQVILDRMIVHSVEEGAILNLNSSASNSTVSLVFNGIGLTKDEYSRLITPIPVGTHNWAPLSSYLESQTLTSMSYEQCHATCLSDLKCKSFSICRRDFDMDCLISQVSFRDASVVSQLRAELVGSIRAKINVTLENSKTVELVKHANCELYNKMYLELFDKRSKPVKQSLSKRFFEPIQSREECAELCVRQNLEALRLDFSLAANSSSLFGPESLTNDDWKKNHEELRKLLSIHKKVSKLLCRAFYYIDHASITTDQESQIKERLADSDYKAEVNLNGYCAVDKVNATKEDKNFNKLLLLDVEEYRFKMDSLYQKQSGIRLLSSELNRDELIAYEKIDSPSENITQAQYSSLRSLVEMGDNFQHATPVLSETTCALICFLQTSGPWPSCRSFDIVRDQSKTETICLLNSITLHQAIATHRSDLVNDNSSSLIQIWHYEPRAGYVLDEALFDWDSQRIEEEDVISNKLGSTIFFIALTCVFISAKIIGIYFGLRVGIMIVKSKNLNENQLIEDNISIRNGNQAFPESITLY